ncbi:MAG: DNA repair protein RecN [Kiritimatiellia bacterium]
MLSKLSVTNLAIVERAEAAFAPGLNVLTGETGAGKSVLMGALELVLGGRAGNSVVRDGAREAEIEAVFDKHVIRRTVTASGRTRAWIDDESVSVAELRELGRTLVDVHGPQANQNVLEEKFQRETLDAYGRVALSAYSAAYAAWREVKERLAALLSAGGGEDELDLLRYQVNELETAGVTAEDDDLAERHAAAAHAEEIVAAANEITEALGGDASVAEILARLQPKFAAMAKHLSEASGWAAEAEELTLRVQELSRGVADAVSRLDADPAAFQEMDARLGVVNRLKRKYRVERPSDLERLLEEKRTRLGDLENRDAKVAELVRACAAAEAAVKAAGAAVTEGRRAAGEKLARAVTKELHDLGFLQAKFGVRLTDATPEPHGCDQVVYMFEPNPGEAARPLADIASSGEIARVMLALKSVLAAHDAVGLLVFDEIDANIGGEIGRIVGEKLRAVSKHHQVIAITHLPQSAVYGDRHFVVSKSVSGGRTRTKVEVATGARRVKEIARMLGGEQLTSVVTAHAEELLELAK